MSWSQAALIVLLPTAVLLLAIGFWPKRAKRMATRRLAVKLPRVTAWNRASSFYNGKRRK